MYNSFNHNLKIGFRGVYIPQQSNTNAVSYSKSIKSKCSDKSLKNQVPCLIVSVFCLPTSTRKRQLNARLLGFRLFLGFQSPAILSTGRHRLWQIAQSTSSLSRSAPCQIRPRCAAFAGWHPILVSLPPPRRPRMRTTARQARPHGVWPLGHVWKSGCIVGSRP